jgi:hypothetical protein
MNFNIISYILKFYFVPFRYLSNNNLCIFDVLVPGSLFDSFIYTIHKGFHTRRRHPFLTNKMSGHNTPIASSSNSLTTPRVAVDISINSDNVGLKSFLAQFCTEGKLFAKIQRTEIGVTQLTLQGNQKQISPALGHLQELLKIHYGAAMVWCEIKTVEEQDKLNSVTIEDTAMKLKRTPSSGEFLEQKFEEISFGGSAATEEFKKIGKTIAQSIITASSTLGRVTGLIPAAKEKHISLKFQGESRDLEVSTILTMESLIDAVNRKFGNPTVPIKSIYRKEAEQVVPVTEVKDLRDGFLYYCLNVNEDFPDKRRAKFTTMEEFFKALTEEEDMSDEQVLKAKTVFSEQGITFKQLMGTGDLAITDAKLKEYGIIQGGLRTAILSVIRNNQ